MKATTTSTLRILCQTVLLLGLSTSALAQEQPNVVIIFADDLGYADVGCFGAQGYGTPHLDRMATEGIKFTSFYVSQAVCGASRVSLMTGLYPEFTGERTFHVTDWRERHADVVTMNQHFKASGFNTVGLGKIYLDVHAFEVV